VEPIETVPEGTNTGPFHERQKGLGATFYEDMGWLWTRAFGDPEKEYWAVRRDVGLWDVSALVKWRFTGPDAAAALDRLTTRRVRDLEPGMVRYGTMLNEDGRMLDEGTTLVIAPDELCFFGNDEREPFVEHMRRHTHGLDVRIENVTAQIPNVAVQGPRSFELLSRLTDADLASLRWFRLIPERIEIAGVRGLVTRTGFTGELGYEFFIDDVDNAERLWDAILDTGATPFGLDAIELLRVEAGLLIQEEDYFPGQTDPYELSLDPYIDFDDHDFIGRNAAEARSAVLPRRLVTLVFEGDAVPDAGADVTQDGTRIGDVRSPQRTPRFGVVALAVVDTAYALNGERVQAGGHDATVRRVPIDDPEKRRPRADPRQPVTVD
jgi:glycine cleavage system T protein (aminomethyltransferase)